jgi:hypothetical protein
VRSDLAQVQVLFRDGRHASMSTMTTGEPAKREAIKERFRLQPRGHWRFLQTKNNDDTSKTGELLP